MTFKGSIYKIPLPFSGGSARKFRPALAISEPDARGDVEFIFITARCKDRSDRIMEIVSGDFVDKPLPFSAFLHLDKPFCCQPA